MRKSEKRKIVMSDIGQILTEPEFSRKLSDFFEQAFSEFEDHMEKYTYSTATTKSVRNKVWLMWHFAGLGTMRIVSLMEHPTVHENTVRDRIKSFLHTLSPNTRKQYLKLRDENMKQLSEANKLDRLYDEAARAKQVLDKLKKETDDIITNL